jgi:hypothetical protein
VHRSLVLNSPMLLVFGLALASISVMCAVTLQIWWLALLTLPGLMIAFRLERSFSQDRLAQLASHEDFSMVRLGNELVGVVSGYFLIGPATDRTLDAADALLQQSEGGNATDLTAAGAETPVQHSSNVPSKLRIWHLSDINSLSFCRGGRSLRIVAEAAEYVHTFPASGDLDGALRLLGRATSWDSATQSYSVFRPNPMATILCLTLIFCAGVLVAGGVGLVNPGQLPLVTWNDVKRRKLRGRAAAAMLIAAMFGEACLFLFQNLHPAALCLLGATGIVSGCWMLRKVLWNKVEGTIRTHGSASA